MSRDAARAATQFFGGRVCLDFANTLDWRTSPEPQELISSYEDLLAWSARRGTLSSRVTGRLARRSATLARKTQTVMERALAVRSEIWRIAESLRDGQHPDLAPVNRMISALPPQPGLVRSSGLLMYDLAGENLEEPLWPVLWSLTAVLTSEDAARLGTCGADGCGWFFVDESPNRSRLWCSSEICGNRERARRSYEKHRAAASASGRRSVRQQEKRK